MYHPDIVAWRQEQLEREFHDVLPHGLQRYPIQEAQGRAQALQPLLDTKGRLSRPLTRDEQSFIANEQFLTKIDWKYWAERYCQVNKEGTGFFPLFPLWESQLLLYRHLCEQEYAYLSSDYPDGFLLNVLKARQLGISTITEALLLHRVTTHTHTKGLIAGDVDEQSQYLFGILERAYDALPWFLRPAIRFRTKHRSFEWETDSEVVALAGKSNRGGLMEEGGAAKGNIGRGKTFSAVHASEVSTWERPEQIDDGLLPAIPRNHRSLAIFESTAKGRRDWWHNHWSLSDRGKTRFRNVFIPWYAEPKKYWLPPPVDWTPSHTTLQAAKEAELHGPRWMLKERISLTKGQLYFYEQTRASFEEKGMLAKFLEEYAADPETCFQHTGRSIFTLPQMETLRSLAKPPQVILDVQPRAELAKLLQKSPVGA